ncbi:MAG: BrnA antitoxin family protein [Victivallaceae bacterium]|nr:BrnA antitoxin family protein [Victivallaceae bacterium]
MKKEYDFTNTVKNPYTAKVKSTITIRLDKETVEYFKELSAKVDLPYQTLINSYLTDCAMKKIQPKINWQ